MKLHGEKFLNFGIFSKILFYAVSLLQMIKPKHSNTYMQGTVLQDDCIDERVFFLPPLCCLWQLLSLIPSIHNMEYMMFNQNFLRYKNVSTAFLEKHYIIKSIVKNQNQTNYLFPRSGSLLDISYFCQFCHHSSNCPKLKILLSYSNSSPTSSPIPRHQDSMQTMCLSFFSLLILILLKSLPLTCVY